MNPIARLEELRAARHRLPNPHPPDIADKPDKLTSEEETCRECRVCRAGVNLGGAPAGVPPSASLSGMSGLSGGGESESGVADRQRWGLPPVEEIPLATMTPPLRPADVALLTAHLKRQPPDVWQWIEDQAGRYAQRDNRRPFPDSLLAAMLDALLWQWEGTSSLTPPDRASRYDRVQEAARKLRDLEAAAQDAARFFVEHSQPNAREGKKLKGVKI